MYALDVPGCACTYLWVHKGMCMHFHMCRHACLYTGVCAQEWLTAVHLSGESLAANDRHANANNMQMKAESDLIPSPALASTTLAGGPAGANEQRFPPPAMCHATFVLGKGPTPGLLLQCFCPFHCKGHCFKTLVRTPELNDWRLGLALSESSVKQESRGLTKMLSYYSELSHLLRETS